SKSGDGCGQYWLTCHGEVIPSAPQLKTLIEFSHRVMSGIDFFVVLILLIWTFKKFEKHQQIRKFALVSFVFIITEALIGAGLVLTGNTAIALTDARPYWAIAHLINTFILLAALSLTAWLGSGGTRIDLRQRPKPILLVAAAVIGMLLIGSSGSLAALSSMLFPVETLAEGFRQDFSDTSHALLRLRISHPILSILIGVYLIFLAGWLKRQDPENRWLGRFSSVHSGLVLFQLAFGAATLFTLAPIIMQLGHLFLADAIWISFILMSACYFGYRKDPGDDRSSAGN
ncbi:MAG: COX15/CtaA family protein, partial [Acidobacteria bacterium]|nr:COX15/CtaA family protein [Acidobacteriota bacterium]